MPLYEFECESCKRRFEASKRLAERNSDEPCTKCRKPARRVLSGFAVGGASKSSGASFGTAASSGGGAACYTGG